MALALLLPVLGFAVFGGLEQQFFPPTNRDQVQIELRLPQQSPLDRTEALALAAASACGSIPPWPRCTGSWARARRRSSTT